MVDFEPIDVEVRYELTSLVVLHSSMSYLNPLRFVHVSIRNSPHFCCASSTVIGRPLQITSSGSMGGIKSVNFSVDISYVRYESGRLHPER
jgi:hypothetical protein